MRSLAAELGLSAMGLYRYFASKAALLEAMWEVVLDEAVVITQAATSSTPGLTPHERLSVGIDAYLQYWEQRPQHFSLVFMNDCNLAESVDSPQHPRATHLAAVQQGGELIDEFITSVGGNSTKASQARDLRMALMVGYLHARLANRRFPWTDLAALRSNTIQAIVSGIESCVCEKHPSALGKA